MSGSDASIYNLIRPVPITPYVPAEERELQRVRLRSLLGAEEMQRMQMDEARRGMETSRRLQDFFSTNPNATPEQVAPIDYKAAEALRRARLEEESKRATIGKDKAAADKSRIEGMAALAKQGRDLIAAATPETLPSILEWGAQNNQQWALKAPPQIMSDPQAFAQWQRQNVLGADEWLKRNAPTIAEQETGRHNLASEATARGNLAVAQGNLGVSRERMAFDKAQPKGVYDPERGILVDPRTATSQPVMAGGAPIGAKDKPLTESQARGQMFGTRAAEADKVLAQLEDKISTTGLAMKRGIENAPLVGGLAGVAGNTLLSADQQMVEQAQRNFVNAVLRQESGAVISPSEFENAQKQYFPQPGDSAAVREQKRQNRQSAIEGFRIASGPAGARIEGSRRTPQETGGKIKFLGFE